jgi:hypothetical protein
MSTSPFPASIVSPSAPAQDDACGRPDHAVLSGLSPHTNSPASFEGRTGFWVQTDCVFIEEGDASSAILEFRRRMAETGRIAVNHNHGTSGVRQLMAQSKIEELSAQLATEQSLKSRLYATIDQCKDPNGGALAAAPEMVVNHVHSLRRQAEAANRNAEEANRLRTELAHFKDILVSLETAAANGGEVGIKFHPGFRMLLAQTFANMLVSAPNYQEIRFDLRDEAKWIVVLVQKGDGKTPHMLRREAEQRATDIAASSEKLRQVVMAFAKELRITAAEMRTEGLQESLLKKIEQLDAAAGVLERACADALIVPPSRKPVSLPFEVAAERWRSPRAAHQFGDRVMCHWQEAECGVTEATIVGIELHNGEIEYTVREDDGNFVPGLPEAMLSKAV